MTDITIQLSDLENDMIIHYFNSGDMLVASFISKGESENGITYYIMPCKRNEVQSVMITNPLGERREKNVDQFENDLRDIHNGSVAFIYR